MASVVGGPDEIKHENYLTHSLMVILGQLDHFPGELVLADPNSILNPGTSIADISVRVNAYIQPA
jgi:hypothetical protein